MPSPIALAGAGLATLGALFAVREISSPPPSGHLILQIEGDANALSVVRITPRPDPCGLHRFESDYSIVVRAADGSELGRYPLDLRVFDLAPGRVGQALRVEGCLVRDPRVATLASIPRLAGASTIEIARRGTVLGRVADGRYGEMIREGELR